MSKTIIAVKHFALGGRKSLEIAVSTKKNIKTGNSPNYCTSDVAFESRSNLLKFRNNFIPAVVALMTSFTFWEFLGGVGLALVTFPACNAWSTDTFTCLSVALYLC